MKKHIVLISCALVLTGCAQSSAQTPLGAVPPRIAAKARAFTPVPAPYPVAEPSAVYSSSDPQDIARIPKVFKVDRLALGLLKWTAAEDRPNDPVVGYEIQRDSGNPVNLIYTVPAPTTEFPFTAGMGGMINTIAGEFWRVRAVFASAARSAWVPSQTFLEHISTSY